MNTEKPILFSTEMVQAILNGRKTQTRRVLKPQPSADAMNPILDYCDYHHQKGFQGRYVSFENDIEFAVKSPYGKVGDLLWVRETFCPFIKDHMITSNYAYKADCDDESERCRQDYIAAGYPYQWKPSIFMPKDACRIWLEITDVRVERLQDISQEDAEQEGVKASSPFAIGYFKNLWDSINGTPKDGKPDVSWKANPWVWVVKFEVLSTTCNPSNI